MKTVSNDALIKGIFSASEETKSRLLLILQGEDVPLRSDEPLLLTMGQAAKLMGLSRSSLWRLLKIGRLEKVQLYPGSFRIRKSDILSLIKESGVRNV